MENSLQHWGVKGMRWGFRRYQNADGSLTPAGKKRYNKEMNKLKEEAKVLRNKARTQSKMDKLEEQRKKVEDLRNKDKLNESKKDEQVSEKPKKADRKSSKMTDDEMREVIARLELEKRYRSLMEENRKVSEAANSKKDGLGKRFIKYVGKDIVLPAATDVSKQLVKSLLTYKMNDTQLIKEMGDEYKLATNNKKK